MGEKSPRYRTGLDSKHSKDKRRFMTKGQVTQLGGWKITKRRHQGSGKLLLNWLNTVLSEGRPVWSDVTREMVANRNLIRCWGWLEMGGRGFLLTWLRRILAKIGLCRPEDKTQGWGLVTRRAWGSCVKFGHGQSPPPSFIPHWAHHFPPAITGAFPPAPPTPKSVHSDNKAAVLRVWEQPWAARPDSYSEV